MKSTVRYSKNSPLFFMMTLFICLFLITGTPSAMQPVEVIQKNPHQFLVNQGPALCAATAFYMIFRYYGDASRPTSFFYDDKGNPLDFSEGGDTYATSKRSSSPKPRLAKGAQIAEWINPYGGGTKWSQLKKGAENLYFRSEPNGPLSRYYTIIDSNDSLIQNTKKNRKTKKELMENKILPLLNQNRPVLVHLARESASGHYIVVVGYNRETETVYYVDPNEKESASIVRQIDYDSFANKKWYEGNVPKIWGNAVWSGKYLSFAHKED